MYIRLGNYHTLFLATAIKEYRNLHNNKPTGKLLSLTALFALFVKDIAKKTRKRPINYERM